MEIDMKQLRELLRALKQFDVTHFAIEQEGVRIEIGRGAANHAPAAAPSQPPALESTAPAASAPPPVPAAEEEASDIAYVTSPFVGTFYRAPDPNAPPFVEVGSEVRAGQVLCIVEAMKLMNEIEADFDCTILEVFVEGGRPVEYGDRLFKVRKR
jgi:acetyl-CoA carboxylase biotin carboxyl carrier protein